MAIQIKVAKLFDVCALCLCQESVFAGSIGKLVLSRPSTGYLHSLAELRAGSKTSIDEYPVINANKSEVSRTLVKEVQYTSGDGYEDYELPRMPPWLTYVGSHKLYQALAGILRLVGFSLISGNITAPQMHISWLDPDTIQYYISYSLLVKQIIEMKCLCQKLLRFLWIICAN